MTTGSGNLPEAHVTGIVLNGALGELLIEGPVKAADMMPLILDAGISAFRPPEQQKQALVRIALMPETGIMVARRDERVVGYLVLLPPDPRERWGWEKIQGLLELGAIEVSPPYRCRGVAGALLDHAFGFGLYEDYLVMACGVYWHWDLRGTGLGIYRYRSLLLNLGRKAGFREVPTDELDIQEHPANFLVARTGSSAPPPAVRKFYRLCFLVGGHRAAPRLRLVSPPKSRLAGSK